MSLISINTFRLKNYFVRKIRRGSLIWSFAELFQSVAYYWSYILYYKLKLKWGRNSIREIHLEFVSYCNLRCRLCSLDHKKPKIRMTEKVLKQFFEDFLTDPRFRNVNTLHLYNAGEVLLHPNIDKMLAIIMEYKIKANAMNIRFPEVGLLTNATVLNQSKSEILLSSGVLDHIRFSMDGGNKENFENMRVRADWNSFVQNIRKFCELNRKDERPVRTGIISLLDFKDKLSTEWMSREFVELLEVVDGYELRYAHNWAGEVDLDLSEAPVKKKQFKTGCSLLMHQLVLLPNGDITVCCADLNSKGVVGNILKNSLSEIYKAPERILMLSQFFKGRKSEIELCKGCETF